jgi:hypothetical protein
VSKKIKKLKRGLWNVKKRSRDTLRGNEHFSESEVLLSDISEGEDECAGELNGEDGCCLGTHGGDVET